MHPSLNEDKPDTVIISAGTSNFTKKRNQTIDIVQTCHKGGVKQVFVSSITCRRYFHEKVNKLNELLQHYAGTYNYEFIDNSCIKEKHLRGDGFI